MQNAPSCGPSASFARSVSKDLSSSSCVCLYGSSAGEARGLSALLCSPAQDAFLGLKLILTFI